MPDQIRIFLMLRVREQPNDPCVFSETLHVVEKNILLSQSTMYNLISRLENIEDSMSYRGTTYMNMDKKTEFVMDQQFERSNIVSIQAVNEKAFQILSAVENSTHVYELSTVEVDDIKLYPLQIYRFGEQVKSVREGDDVKHYGPLICLATLQISSRGKRIILYSLSCKHKNTAHGKESLHHKLSDADAQNIISSKLKDSEFQTELLKLARQKPANDIAIGFDDSRKY